MGHGTHVAALAGGTTVGAARNATLHSIRIFGCRDGTSTSTILKAIEHVVQQKSGSRATIMSMSFGGPYSASINLCVKIAYDRGILPVASAGNGRQYASNRSPASSQFAITVGATDKYDRAASFTNYGCPVNIFAPGVSIKSASRYSNNGYTHKSGTSMAAPLVSGAAAMILSVNPSFTPKQVMEELISQSTKNVVNFQLLPVFASELTPNRLLNVKRTSCIVDGKYTVYKSNSFCT
jgi:subtilisin family serine protease